MTNDFLKEVTSLYKDCDFWAKLYLKIRLHLTPFIKVAEYIPQKGIVYDLGCGYGMFSNLMNLQFPKRKVVGIDLSEKRIDIAQKTVGSRKNIRFICADLKDISLEKCGTIVIYDVLHHLDYKDQESLLNQCFEKLGSRGLLVIKDNDTDPHWKFIWNYLHEILTRFLLVTKSDRLSFRTKEEFLKLLFKAGFVVESVNIPTNLPYPFILYICRKVSKEKKDKGIVFVNPPLSLEQRYGAIAKGGRNAPPLGICTLAAVTRKKGYKTFLIDACVSSLSLTGVIREIIDLSPKYVGITASTIAIETAAELAEQLKKKRPDIFVLVGGPHITALPEETLKCYPDFDFAVVGEGEETLCELLKTLFKKRPNLKLISGLAFRDKDKIVVNLRRQNIENLDSLPIPAWDLLPSLTRYYSSSPQSFDRLPSSSLVTSRGCPNLCTFCDRSIFGNRLRGYSPDYVLKMVKILCSQYGVRHILFDDDTFTILKPRLEKICQLIIREKLDLTWTCLSRVDNVDEEMLKLMRKAGCWQILYGIESGSQEILDKLKKGITLTQIREALNLTRKAGIRTKGFFILGTPFETKKTAKETIDFINQVDLDDFHMTFFSPFPGSEIFDKEIKNKKLNKKLYESNWSRMNEWEPVFFPSGLNREELVSLSKEAFRQFYFTPRVIFSYLSTAVRTHNFTPFILGSNALLKYLFSKRK